MNLTVKKSWEYVSPGGWGTSSFWRIPILETGDLILQRCRQKSTGMKVNEDASRVGGVEMRGTDLWERRLQPAPSYAPATYLLLCISPAQKQVIVQIDEVGISWTDKNGRLSSCVESLGRSCLDRYLLLILENFWGTGWALSDREITFYHRWRR